MSTTPVGSLIVQIQALFGQSSAMTRESLREERDNLEHVSCCMRTHGAFK